MCSTPDPVPAHCLDQSGFFPDFRSDVLHSSTAAKDDALLQTLQSYAHASSPQVGHAAAAAPFGNALSLVKHFSPRCSICVMLQSEGAQTHAV